MVDFRINWILQIGAVRNRTYRGRKCLFIFRFHHKSISVALFLNISQSQNPAPVAQLDLG